MQIESHRDLLRVEEVLEMHELHGKFNLLLKIRAKNLNQLRDIVERIRFVKSLILLKQR